MTLKNIHFKSLALSGFFAGYLMYFADHYLKGMFGLFGLFPGTDSPWWMLLHHINSMIFAIPFALPAVYRRLPGARWVKGTIYGCAWWVVTTLIMLISGSLGAVVFQGMTVTVSVAISSLLLHLLYGFTLGALYLPPQQAKKLEEQVYHFATRQIVEEVHHQN